MDVDIQVKADVKGEGSQKGSNASEGKIPIEIYDPNADLKYKSRDSRDAKTR